MSGQQVFFENIVLPIVTVSLFFGILVALPFVLLKPFIQHARKVSPEDKTNFMTSDLFALCFLAQLPFAIFSWPDARIGDAGIELSIFAVLLFVAVWWIGLKQVNYFGITNQLKRVVAISLTIPLGFVSGFLCAICIQLIIIQELPAVVPVTIAALILGFVCWSSRWVLDGVERSL